VELTPLGEAAEFAEVARRRSAWDSERRSGFPGS
jgi:hypothetical protein